MLICADCDQRARMKFIKLIFRDTNKRIWKNKFCKVNSRMVGVCQIRSDRIGFYFEMLSILLMSDSVFCNMRVIRIADKNSQVESK
jgi:hypothetical protein